MSWPPDLTELQELAEAAMITPCRVVHPTDGTFDPNTNQTTSTATLTWSGYCNIETREIQVGFSESGEGLVASTDYQIQVPVEATAPADDLLQELNEDGDVVRAFFIKGNLRPTHEVQQTLQVVERPVVAITVT
jgi:hypothetical protein